MNIAPTRCDDALVQRDSVRPGRAVYTGRSFGDDAALHVACAIWGSKNARSIGDKFRNSAAYP